MCVRIEAGYLDVTLSEDLIAARNRIGKRLIYRCTICGQSQDFCLEHSMLTPDGTVLATDVATVTVEMLLLAGEQETAGGESFGRTPPLKWFKEHTKNKAHRNTHAKWVSFYVESMGYLKGKSARHHELSWRAGDSIPCGKNPIFAVGHQGATYPTRENARAEIGDMMALTGRAVEALFDEKIFVKFQRTAEQPAMAIPLHYEQVEEVTPGLIYWNQTQVGDQYCEASWSRFVPLEELCGTAAEYFAAVLGTEVTENTLRLPQDMFEYALFEVGLKNGRSAEPIKFEPPADYVEFAEKISLYKSMGFMPPETWVNDLPSVVDMANLLKRPPGMTPPSGEQTERSDSPQGAGWFAVIALRIKKGPLTDMKVKMVFTCKEQLWNQLWETFGVDAWCADVVEIENVAWERTRARLASRAGASGAPGSNDSAPDGVSDRLGVWRNVAEGSMAAGTTTAGDASTVQALTDLMSDLSLFESDEDDSCDEI